MDSLLSPNQQLLAYCSMMVVVVLAVATATSLLLRRIEAVRNAVGDIAPLWQHVKAELSAIMRHDEDWAKELDVLLDESNLEPGIKMPPERRVRLVELLTERAVCERSGLRLNERKAARVYLAVMPLAETESTNLAKLTGLKVVGTHTPGQQSAKDAEARKDAIAH